jgi:UDP-GlcNAc:undecaprenyl-phosphate/decaprenyl-phosphate GlcNAc-1-phosphate transferase
LDLFYTLAGFVLAGVVISITCNILLLRFSQSLGIRNKNDVIVRWSNESKPSLGGVSFFIAFIFGTMGYAVVYSGDNIFHNLEFIGLLAAGSLAFLMGLSDDAYNTKPLVKLSVQIACGLILAFTGTVIGFTGMHWLNVVITVIWVIGIMNSLNMLDNMDGITGTTVLFILGSCLASEVILHEWSRNVMALTLIVQIGAILGFLVFNVHPSKLFMGDAGSQFIGLFCAFFAVHNLWNAGMTAQITPWTGMFVTLLAFTPAAADTLTVVINRLRKGQSPMVGGKDHTTHHLVYSGLNDRQVWYVFLGIGFCSFLLVILAVAFAKWGDPWMSSFLALFFVVVFAWLYRNTIVHRRK